MTRKDFHIMVVHSQVMLRMGSTCRRHKPATLGANKPKCLAEVEEEEAKAEEAHKENTWWAVAIGDL
ncbi:hypothetical protein DAI22_04g108300 [Oryza sativa Japonica Group]|uniref:Uncharacterized protein n=1 Tax=Oryza rufipogon TaxID=4529 RepID=A0A0E0P8D9_ORYRU|nr:hypothetical protein DAI22_04g108300 [Oryza sativa Japonica Group]